MIVEKDQTRAWARALTSAANSIALPAHLASRIALLVSLDEVRYLDVMVPHLSGPRVDVDVVILTDTAILIARCEQIDLGRQPVSEDASTVVTMRPLAVTDLVVDGPDRQWSPDRFDGAVYVREGAITAHFDGGTVVSLPMSSTASEQLPAALAVLKRALESQRARSTRD